MKRVLRGGWLLCFAVAATGCGGNDRQASEALDRSAPASSAQSPGAQKSVAPDQSVDELWRKAASLNATELQEAEKVAVQRSGADRSGASSATAKAVTNRLAVYRFFNSQTSAHFYTSSTAERDHVIATLPQFHYEGQAFWASASATAGMSPVYRFFNQQTGVHFYTISDDERDHILASLPQLHYEGVAYYASKTAGADLFPLYRFYLAGKGYHFYTGRAQEAAQVRANLPQYRDEGVSYYLPAAAASGQPAPTVNLTANLVSVPFGEAATLSWSSSGATDCSASGGWTGTRSTSGSASTSLLSATTVFTLVCSGPGGSVARSVAVTPASGSGTFMGHNKILIGGSFSDETAAAAPFDVRYAYIHSQPAASPTYYTDARCSAAAVNSGWWGCWGGTTTAPGNEVTWRTNFSAQATWQGKPRPQMRLWTWYSLRDLGDMAGQGDGPGEVQAIDRADLLTLYLNDYRFFLQKIGNTRAMVDLEPDFWGYVKSLGNPHNIPAKVTVANPTDCAQEENSAAGLAHCLVSMARKYAPNLGVGMHASCFDYQSDPQGCVQFLREITKDADFMVTDVSDRDSAWYDLQGQHWHWWNGTKGADALAFYKLISEGTGKPLVLWQIPVGNMTLNNTLNHYQDDKVDYLFSHLDQVADAHIAGLFFGPGHHEQTSAETDGGNLINKTINLWNAGGTPLR